MTAEQVSRALDLLYEIYAAENDCELVVEEKEAA